MILNIATILPNSNASVSGGTLAGSVDTSTVSGPALLEQDRAEFSPEGLALSRAVSHSSLRLARTESIRAEIEAGTFLTPERLAGTVERLLDVLM